MNLNRVEISGAVAEDPDVRVIPNGLMCVSFELSVSSRSQGAAGEAVARQDNIRCVAYGARAAALSKTVSKGTRMAVAGRLRRTYWNDVESGERRMRTDVVVEGVDMLLPKRGNVVESDIEFADLEAAFMADEEAPDDEGERR